MTRNPARFENWFYTTRGKIQKFLRHYMEWPGLRSATSFRKKGLLHFMRILTIYSWKFLCSSFPTNVRRFLHQKKHNFISFPTVPKVFLPSGSILQQFSFFWCHPILEISRIHKKCANCVSLYSKTLQKILSNRSFVTFYGANFTNAS